MSEYLLGFRASVLQYQDEKRGGERRDREDILLLRSAGCTCTSPLLRRCPGVGPRCRLCNTVAFESKGEEG